MKYLLLSILVAYFSMPSRRKPLSRFIGRRSGWGICPRIIDSWLENNVEMLEGKTIKPFATSGSSTIDGAVSYLRKNYPTLTFTDGKLYK